MIQLSEVVTRRNVYNTKLSKNTDYKDDRYRLNFINDAFVTSCLLYHLVCQHHLPNKEVNTQ